MPTFCIETLGCKVNHAESMAMKASMEKEGYTYTESAPCDVYIINSCTVTHVAAAKTRQLVRRAIAASPGALIIVTGCYSEVSPDEILEIEGVSFVVGQDGKMALPELIEEFKRTSKLSNLKRVFELKAFEEEYAPHSDDRTRAFLKVQDGCDRFCTYCIICHARGKIRSRSLESTLAEIDHLVGSGFKEVVLSGIHLSSYGRDLEGATLIDLIEQVAKTYPDLRIRLSSLEPCVITEEFVERLCSYPNLCEHFHLSLQSGSDPILKSMNRAYTSAEYMGAVEMLKAAFHKPCLTTDVIVGFPGESDAYFEDSMDFCRRVGFAKMHVFPYSKRKGTPAAKMPDQLPSYVKKQRVKAAIALSDETGQAYMKSLLGDRGELLIEKIEDGWAKGHLKNYMPFHIEAGDLKVNEIYPVKILTVDGDVLKGELL